MGNLEPGVAKTLDLKDRGLAGHSVAVPLAGEVTLSVSLELENDNIRPTMFIYGPRGDDGLFGTCVALNGLGEAGEPLVLVHDVAPDAGGEYLIVVGVNPPSAKLGKYTVRVDCNGSECEKAKCPTFESLGCAGKVCPGGFATSETADGVTCPTCECEERLCGPFKKLIFDQCVCDCPAPEPGMAVCGADGKTWPTKCHATCNEVPVANDQGPCSKVCPGLENCPKKCDIAHVIVDGCASCECAEKCDYVSGLYRPVCGYDGFTHTNADVARCKGVDIAYVGACLPFCSIPSDCKLTCKHGLMPTLGFGENCFKCQCMDPKAKPDKGKCSADDALWCARYKPPKGGTPGKAPGRVPQGNEVELSKPVMGLHMTRTFINMCAAKAAGWKPIVASACPTGVCQQTGHCKDAKASLEASYQALGGNVAVPEVHCQKAGDAAPKDSFGVCAFKPVQGPSCTTGNGGCPPGTKCIPGPGGQGAICEGECACLKFPGSAVYDPVCVGGITYYNACFAFCAAAWPMEHPGACCSPRVSVSAVKTAYLEINKQCNENGLIAHVRLDNACPPSVDYCAESENQEECCKPFSGQQPKDK